MVHDGDGGYSGSARDARTWHSGGYGSDSDSGGPVSPQSAALGRDDKDDASAEYTGVYGSAGSGGQVAAAAYAGQQAPASVAGCEPFRDARDSGDRAAAAPGDGAAAGNTRMHDGDDGGHGGGRERSVHTWNSDEAHHAVGVHNRPSLGMRETDRADHGGGGGDGGSGEGGWQGPDGSGGRATAGGARNRGDREAKGLGDEVDRGDGETGGGDGGDDEGGVNPAGNEYRQRRRRANTARQNRRREHKQS